MLMYRGEPHVCRPGQVHPNFTATSQVLALAATGMLLRCGVPAATQTPLHLFQLLTSKIQLSWLASPDTAQRCTSSLYHNKVEPL